MKRTRIWSVTIAAVLVTACAVTNINLPSVTETPTGERLPGKIIWHDLLTNDVTASKKFYGDLFGWQFESIGSSSGLSDDTAYTLIRHEGKLIGGMIDTVALNGRSDISQWVIAMSVTDVDSAARKFSSSGGTVLTPPQDLQRRGRIAVVQDKAGALLALLETRDGDPADRDPEINGFLWDELWTDNIDEASAFYADVAGFESAELDIDNDDSSAATYRLLKHGDTPRVGILQRPLPDLNPVWVSYLRVESPAAITARVGDLGGRVIVEAQPRDLGGEVAFVAGPSGAGIALQTWPLK
jgi:predicted enzyme related to lactoylglutathione lyase